MLWQLNNWMEMSRGGRPRVVEHRRDSNSYRGSASLTACALVLLVGPGLTAACFGVAGNGSTQNQAQAQEPPAQPPPAQQPPTPAQTPAGNNNGQAVAQPASSDQGAAPPASADRGSAQISTPRAAAQPANTGDEPAKSKAQIVTTSITTRCGGATRSVAFVSGHAILQNKQEANAVGIVLLPFRGRPDNVFCVYSFGPGRTKPAKRDDTSGRLTGKLQQYDSAKIQMFFTEISCPLQPGIVQAIGELLDAGVSTAEELAVDLRDQKSIAGVGAQPEIKDDELHTGGVIRDEADFAASMHSFALNQQGPDVDDVERKLRAEVEDLKKGNARLEAKLRDALSNVLVPNDSWGWALMFILALFLLGGSAIATHFGLSERNKAKVADAERKVRQRFEAKLAPSDLRARFDGLVARSTESFNRDGGKPAAIKTIYLDLRNDLLTFRDLFLTVQEDGKKPDSPPEGPSTESTQTPDPPSAPPVDLQTVSLEVAIITPDNKVILQLGPDQLGELKEISSEAHNLFYGLRKRFNPESKRPSETRGNVEHFLDYLQSMGVELADQGASGTPTETLSSIQLKLKNDGEKARNHDRLAQQVDRIKEAVEPLKKTDEKLVAATTRIIRDYQNAVSMFADNCSLHNISLHSKVTAISNRIQTDVGIGGRLSAQIETVIRKARDEEAAAKSAADFKRALEQIQATNKDLKSKAEGGRSLAAEVSRYLRYGSATVTALREKMESEPYRSKQLRLRLSAALLALDNEIERGSRHDLIDALNIRSVRDKMNIFLTELERLSAEAIWKDALRGEQWVHDLMRADLLIRNYLIEGRNSHRIGVPCMGSLSDTVQHAATTVRAALQEFHVDFVRVDLLEQPPAGAEIERNASQELYNLAEASDRVREKLSTGAAGFVVDVLTFPVTLHDEPISKGCVVIVNPSAWLERRALS